MNVVSMDTVSMGMVSTDKNFNTLLCACMILSLQVCVYVQWYLQTNTVAFISAPLSGPLSHEQTYRTQIPRRWKNPLLLGQEVQRLQWWGHHSRSGTRVWDWSVTTELKDTGTPFRCKLYMREKSKLWLSSCHHLDSSNGKQAQTICFSFAQNYFCSPTHTHSETRTRVLLTHIGRTAAVRVEQRTVSLALWSTSPWQHFLLHRRCSWTRSTHTYTQANVV